MTGADEPHLRAMLGYLWPVPTCPGSDLEDGAQLSHHPALSPDESGMLPT